MDQKFLLPPYAATTMDLKSPAGKLPLRFPPLPPKSTAPFHAGGHRDDRCSGGLCRTIVLCVLALAVCAGFVLLYLQMRDLERQVQELRHGVLTESSAKAGSYGSFDEEETEPGRTYHSREPEKTRDRSSDRLAEEPDWHDWNVDDVNADADDSTHHEAHTRARRSSGSSLSTRRRFVSQVGIPQERDPSARDPSAHVVPRTAGHIHPTDNYYPASAWFAWTDQTMTSHASIPLHSSGRYLLAPHAGYYYIYSQVTLMSCNNGSDVIPRGHSLYVKSGCGQNNPQRLTYTVTTPYNRNGGCTYDTGYIGGVYYLEKHDHVGVKPYVPSGIVQSRIFLKPSNSYFGMIQISKFNGGTQRCHPLPY